MTIILVWQVVHFETDEDDLWLFCYLKVIHQLPESHFWVPGCFPGVCPFPSWHCWCTVLEIPATWLVFVEACLVWLVTLWCTRSMASNLFALSNLFDNNGENKSNIVKPTVQYYDQNIIQNFEEDGDEKCDVRGGYPLENSSVLAHLFTVYGQFCYFSWFSFLFFIFLSYFSLSEF